MSKLLQILFVSFLATLVVGCDTEKKVKQAAVTKAVTKTDTLPALLPAPKLETKPPCPTT